MAGAGSQPRAVSNSASIDEPPAGFTPPPGGIELEIRRLAQTTAFPVDPAGRGIGKTFPKPGVQVADRTPPSPLPRETSGVLPVASGGASIRSTGSLPSGNRQTSSQSISPLVGMILDVPNSSCQIDVSHTPLRSVIVSRSPSAHNLHACSRRSFRQTPARDRVFRLRGFQRDRRAGRPPMHPFPISRRGSAAPPRPQARQARPPRRRPLARVATRRRPRLPDPANPSRVPRSPRNSPRGPPVSCLRRNRGRWRG